MNDLISRQAAIEVIDKHIDTFDMIDANYLDGLRTAMSLLNDLPSAQTEPHYCRECKWSRCHIDVDKHGKSETYWRCLNWVAETDEEGYCHEWKERTDGLSNKQTGGD